MRHAKHCRREGHGIRPQTFQGGHAASEQGLDMLTFNNFTGINNILPEHRRKESNLVAAVNVDIGLTGELSRRGGYSEVSDSCHKNLHQAQGFMLATVGSTLTAIFPNGDRHAVHPAMGPERVWYCNLPNGMTTFSNGLIHGMTDGITGSDWSIPAPDSLGATGDTHGGLDKGSYRYHLTFVRLSDGLEGPAISSEPIEVGLGGLRIGGLPERADYKLNVYLSGKDGEGAYLAGSTTGSEFLFAGTNSTLVLPCRTLDARPMPVGSFTAVWRGRVLVAQGNVLWASMPGAAHLCQWRDFRQFSSPITMIAPVADGIYVGTESELVFLAGDRFDQMAYRAVAAGYVVPGSGVVAPGERVKLGDGVGRGDAVLCIVGGFIVAGFGDGQLSMLTEDRYKTTTQEVAATFRTVNGIPQYIAVPQ